MGMLRTHVVLPEQLIVEIDALVGARGRSAFLVETAQAELKRRKLLAFWRVTSLPGGTRIIQSWRVERRLGFAG